MILVDNKVISVLALNKLETIHTFLWESWKWSSKGQRNAEHININV